MLEDTQLMEADQSRAKELPATQENLDDYQKELAYYREIERVAVLSEN